MNPQPNSTQPLSNFDAWLIKRALEGLRDPDQYPNASPLLRDFIKHSNGFTAPGWKDQLYRLIGADGITRVHKQNFFAPPPTIQEQTTAQQALTPYRLIRVDELAKLPPLEWLIDGEIPARGLTVLYGASGAGKSFVALDYALSVAQHSPIIYMAGEGEAGYAHRVGAWCRHNALRPGNAYFVLGAVPMLQADEIDRFIDICRNIRPALIVVDTLARAMLGGDENHSRDMGLFVDACARMVLEVGAAILIVHHTNKTGNSERGSSALRGAADSMIELSNDDGLIQVECSKSKDSRPFVTRYLSLYVVTLDDGATSCVTVPAARRESTGALTENAKAVIRALKMLPLSTGAKVSTLRTVTGISERSLYRILDRLMRQGSIEQTSKGEPYKLTEDGNALQVD